MPSYAYVTEYGDVLVYISMAIIIAVLLSKIIKEKWQLYQTEDGIKSLACSTKATSVSHTWIIENFSSYIRMGTGSDCHPSINSSTFAPAGYEKLKFSLEVYPRGEDKDSKSYLSIYLNLDAADADVNAVYIISIINEKGEKCKTIGNGFDLKLTKFVKDETGWGREYYVSHDELLKSSNGLLPEDKLILYCEVLVVPPLKFKEAKLDKNDSCIAVGDLFNSKNRSDIIMVVGDKEWPAHKFVLAARSPVFADLFRFSKEKDSDNRVTIPEVSPQLFEQLLEFCYTGKISSLELYAQDLLSVADKFQIDSLKNLCEQFLCSQINAKSALDLLNLADIHNASQLKKKAYDYIRGQTLDAIHAAKDKKPKKLINTISLDQLQVADN